MARRVDDLGRIVLPIEMRRRLAIKPGDALDIAVDGSAIVLRKIEARCVFCDQGGENLRPYRHKQICADCARGVAGGATGAVPSA
ncbi:MAG: AbrB/MazE/SpoVT family DNA-binding domain-containing protein [Acidimicrobiales bacterium]